MHPEDEEAVERPLSETTLCVRYTGTSNWRYLTRSDLAGTPSTGDETGDQLAWSPQSEVDFGFWLEYAGSRERALEVLRQHAHEFELVGPGAEEFAADVEDEEFSIGGSVE